MTPHQAFKCIIDTGNPRNGCNELVAVLPRIGAVVCSEHITPDDFKILPELVLKLALPLKAEVCRGHD